MAIISNPFVMFVALVTFPVGIAQGSDHHESMTFGKVLSGENQ